MKSSDAPLDLWESQRSPWAAAAEEELEGLGRTFFYGTASSPTQEISFWFAAGGENAIRRLLGCALLSIMPDEGVEEAVISLRDILEFRSKTYHVALPKPQMNLLTTGQVVRAVQRPELVISE